MKRQIKTRVITSAIILFILCLPGAVLFADEESGDLDEEIKVAMESMPDKYDIPQDLYRLDKRLLIYKTTITSKKNSAGWFGFGGLALAGLGVVLWQAAPNLVWAPYGNETEIPYGIFLVGLGGGFSIYSLVGILPSIPKAENSLREYYKTHYQDIY